MCRYYSQEGKNYSMVFVLLIVVLAPMDRFLLRFLRIYFQQVPTCLRQYYVCRYYSQEGKNYSMVVVLLNLVVVFICISSLILCLRALLRAQILKHETDAFFYK